MTNGTRHMSRLVNEDLDNVRPEKSLTVPLKSAYGRDNYGHRTCRDRQKGHKRLYRIIDFKRNKLDVPARVESIEYDPNRTANIASMAASTAPGSGKGLSPSAPASRAGPSSSVRAEKYPGVPCATFHAQRSARLR